MDWDTWLLGTGMPPAHPEDQFDRSLVKTAMDLKDAWVAGGPVLLRVHNYSYLEARRFDNEATRFDHLGSAGYYLPMAEEAGVAFRSEEDEDVEMGDESAPSGVAINKAVGDRRLQFALRAAQRSDQLRLGQYNVRGCVHCELPHRGYRPFIWDLLLRGYVDRGTARLPQYR